MLGLLNVHKPVGISSRDAVNHVQRLVRPDKVGHAGTLDPLAEGVLVVLVGAATRLTEFVQQMPKTYRATFRLGQRSDTDDAEGQIVTVPVTAPPGPDAVESALEHFRGDIVQIPPAFSAVKVAGQRAYALARRGQAATLQPRTVSVYDLVLQEYDYPMVRVEVCCGSGTYVRSIGRDLGERLGTGAIMTELCRCAIGAFRLEDSVQLDDLTRESLPQYLLPAARALDGRPQFLLSADEAARIAHGQFLRRKEHGWEGPVAALDPEGELRAVLVPADADRLRPTLVLPVAAE